MIPSIPAPLTLSTIDDTGWANTRAPFCNRITRVESETWPTELEQRTPSTIRLSKPLCWEPPEAFALISVVLCLPACVQIKQLPAHWCGTLYLVSALLNWAGISRAVAGPGGTGQGGKRDRWVCQDCVLGSGVQLTRNGAVPEQTRPPKGL